PVSSPPTGATAAATLSGLVTSKARAVTSAPLSARAAAAAPSATSFRPLSTSAAPAPASARAMASPRPRLEPVTRARRPARLKAESCVLMIVLDFCMGSSRGPRDAAAQAYSSIQAAGRGRNFHIQPLLPAIECSQFRRQRTCARRGGTKKTWKDRVYVDCGYRPDRPGG